FHSLYSKSGNVVSHNYVTTPTRTTTTPSPPQCFHVVGICTLGDGYDKGLMRGLSPKDKGEAESMTSSPNGVKRVKRHIPLLRSRAPVGSLRAKMSKSSKDPRSLYSSA